MAQSLNLICDASGKVHAQFFQRASVPKVKDVHDLGTALSAAARRVLERLPKELLIGHTRLRAIVRDKSFGEKASAYTFSDQTINITVPFKLKGAFLSMDKSLADSVYCRLVTKQGAGAASFWATSPLGRHDLTDNLFEWIIRHEVGHSVDKLIQFSNQWSGDLRFGGWVRYTEFDDLLLEVLIGLGLVKGSRDWNQIQTCLATDPYDKLYEKLDPEYDAKETWTKRDGWKGLRYRPLADRKIDTGTEETDAALKEAFGFLDRCVGDPWLEGDQDRNVLAGRRYHFMDQYERWYSCDDRAFGDRISNYQFSAPCEWFAEIFAAYFGEGTKMRSLLIGPSALNDIVDWLWKNLDPAKRGSLYASSGGQTYLIEAPLPVGAAVNDADNLEETCQTSWYFDNKFNKANLNKGQWARGNVSF